MKKLLSVSGIMLVAAVSLNSCAIEAYPDDYYYYDRPVRTHIYYYNIPGYRYHNYQRYHYSPRQYHYRQGYHERRIEHRY